MSRRPATREESALEIAEAVGTNPSAEDAAAALAAAEEAIRARDAMTQELKELSAQSAAARESLSARLASATSEIDTLTAQLRDRDQALARQRKQCERADETQRRLEEQLAEAARELANAQQSVRMSSEEQQRLRGQMKALEQANGDLSRRLQGRDQELAAVLGRLQDIEGARGTLDQVAAELRAEAAAARTERAQMAAQLDAVALHNDGLSRAVAERDQALGDLERAAATLEASLRSEISRLENESERKTGRILELEEQLRASDEWLAVMDTDRKKTAEDLRRLGGSSAWRMSHTFSRVFRRLTFRPIRTGGAVQVMLDRLEKPPALTAGRSKPAGDE